MKKQYIFPEIEVLNVLTTEFLENSPDDLQNGATDGWEDDGDGWNDSNDGW